MKEAGNEPSSFSISGSSRFLHGSKVTLGADTLSQRSRTCQRKFSELQIQRKCDDAVRLLDAEHRGISVGIGTRSEFSSQCKSGDVIPTRETFSHVDFALLRPDTALVTYEDDASFLVESEVLTLKAHAASVWIKRGSDWLLGLHAATSIPFAVTEEGKVRLLYPDTSQSKEVSK